MTTRGLNKRFIGVSGLAAIASTITMVLGSETTIARETFTQTAERFGLWAALSVGMTASAVIGLIYLVRFTLTTMANVIDDNSFAVIHFSNVLSKRKCLHDSDLTMNEDELSDDPGPLGATGRRVLERRKERQLKTKG